MPTLNGITLGKDSPLLTLSGRARRELTPTEADDQMALVELLLGRFWDKGGIRRLGLGLTRKWPELMLLYAINPNAGSGGRKFSKAAAGKAKAMGQLAGMPDLCLPVMRGPFAGLYLELKRAGGRLSEEQRTLLVLLREQHYAVLPAWSVGHAAAALNAYLSLPRGEPSTHAAAGDGVTRQLRERQARFYFHYEDRNVR